MELRFDTALLLLKRSRMCEQGLKGGDTPTGNTFVMLNSQSVVKIVKLCTTDCFSGVAAGIPTHMGNTFVMFNSQSVVRIVKF